ncbi:hypothetical protein PV755_46555 [Streptomyces caniscabiei]|uniref:Uncharacterized protein n=1 Tax=Streptomyces caniscabiei TaxID=2746961 RepID=A0A927LG21_9ACTN|nr:hypothetical protein [Streptomyces caniscabiei]MBD9730194.1 hypothetical protein [Streptomyces caniscabiei]MDX3516267.1 hypothetical protein [Streptomyces caniscabiei]MDX3725268.1 hypothetical protein [Streptomyces caniscabiei]WEO25167.1 hypothetical protein IHE65_19385 [Streptomyces caniscabiei]WEO26319.1 hypothetical protein IHE65_25910 [Streptomyces caniscabiei]
MTSNANDMLAAHQAKVQAVRDQLEATVNRINNHKGLSFEAKQGRVSRAYLDAQQQMAVLRDSGRKELERHEQRLLDRVFGNKGGDGQTLMAQRQANQMAASITNQAAAMDMLRTAQQDGDTQLAKAIAGRAYSNNWVDVVDHWNHDGSNDPAIRLLNEHREMPQVNRFIWDAEHHVGQPREIENMKPHEISRAAQADYSDGGEAA